MSFAYIGWLNKQRGIEWEHRWIQ